MIVLNIVICICIFRLGCLYKRNQIQNIMKETFEEIECNSHVLSKDFLNGASLVSIKLRKAGINRAKEHQDE